MKDKLYLTISKNGIKKMTKTPPSLQADELAFKINVTINDKIFQKPYLETNLDINDDRKDFEIVIREMESQIKDLKERKTELGDKK